jgi:hypothetical protein
MLDVSLGAVGHLHEPAHALVDNLLGSEGEVRGRNYSPEERWGGGGGGDETDKSNMIDPMSDCKTYPSKNK